MAGRFPKSLARKLGHGGNYFIVMRRCFREKYDYIASLSKNDKRALRLYDAEREVLRSKLADIYLAQEDNREISSFGNYLIENGIYSHISSWYWMQRTLLNNPKGIVKHAMFLKCKKILELYPAWVGEKEAA